MCLRTVRVLWMILKTCVPEPRLGVRYKITSQVCVYTYINVLETTPRAPDPIIMTCRWIYYKFLSKPSAAARRPSFSVHFRVTIRNRVHYNTICNRVQLVRMNTWHGILCFVGHDGNLRNFSSDRHAVFFKRKDCVRNNFDAPIVNWAVLLSTQSYVACSRVESENNS